MAKKLKLAFIWHFHQPLYQENFNSDFLMPWTRLHATKDYLDMLYRVDDYKNLRLNFNLSPVLVDSLLRYSQGAHDIHSRLLISDVKELDYADKGFILNNFFDANYNHLILPRKHYTELYNKRYSKDNITINDFTDEEYSDIMANFTLAWIDNKFLEIYPELKELSEKEIGYTLDDRIKIYEYSIKIIKDIIPKFKKSQEEGKIEISTNPYYHPVLPLLINSHELFCPYKGNIPKDPSIMADDALAQTLKSLDRFEELFGKRPKGIWLSEHCVSQGTIEMLNNAGVDWTVTDIGILSNTIDKEFSRSFDGNIEDPFDLCIPYKIESSKNINTKIIFADSFVSSLVGFDYGNYNGQAAANDLYEKIKTLQSKLQNSPQKEHILTIAMDGENCWETYENDGDLFLKTLYKLICDDKDLETVLVSDYIQKNKKFGEIETIASGSWINRNFDLWIGEPVKNIAWAYLNKARSDVIEYAKDEKTFFEAIEEIYIAQGSDWFWWYGEPNDSGCDHIFDHLFRTHLKNAYRIIDKPSPSEFDIPLISIVGKPLRRPKRLITPLITGKSTDAKEEDIADSGYIFLPDNPTFGGSKAIRGVYFCNDKENVYLRFDVDKTKMVEGDFASSHQIYVYAKNIESQNLSPIRLISKTTNIVPILKNLFSHEIKLTLTKDNVFLNSFSKALPNGLWSLKSLKGFKCSYDDVLELAISHDDFGIEKGQTINFCIISATNGIIDVIFPQDILLELTNPK